MSNCFNGVIDARAWSDLGVHGFLQIYASRDHIHWEGRMRSSGEPLFLYFFIVFFFAL